MERQEPQELRRPRYPVTMQECQGLIRVEIRGVEARDEDGQTLRGACVSFLELPEHAEAFGGDSSIRQHCLKGWAECAKTIGMDRDALLAIARDLHPDEVRELAASGA